LSVILLFITTQLNFAQKDDAYNLGDTYMQVKQYEKAAQEYSKAIEKNTKDAYGYYKRGVALLFMNNFDAAIADFTKALEINKNDPDCHNNRGLALSYKGDLVGAMKDFDKAIELDPGFGQAFINRGSALVAIKEFDKAVKDFDKAIKIDPKNPEIYLQRARLFYLKDDFKKSVKDYSTSIALGIGSSKVYYNRANSYYKLEMYDEAIKDYSKALELDPDDLDALNNRSFTYKMLNKTKEADEDKKLLDEKKNSMFTPFEQLKFKSFSSKGKEITFDLPENWKIIESSQESPDKLEFIVTPENTNVTTDGMVVGVTIGILKNLSKTLPVKNESEILDFWKGSMDKSNEDMLIYKMNWQRHLQLFGHATILNRTTIQATENHMPFGLYEYALAWGDNLIYLYYQAPEVNFDYFEKIFEKSYKSLIINNKALGLEE
jgi:tetratricopeptide (TPR) repeat protein